LGKRFFEAFKRHSKNTPPERPPIKIMFALFRFDLPIAVMEQLVAQLDQMKTSPLTDEELKKLADYQNNLAKAQNLPKLTQGVYAIYLGKKAVYAGKADNLRSRLGDHKFKLSGRRNIDPAKIGFKCLLLESSWSTSANESLLIAHYKNKGECEWNMNGFGINDPGRHRDGALPNAFDKSCPINEDWEVTGINDKTTVGEVLSKLKQQLPFLPRYVVDSKSESIPLELKGVPRTAKEVLVKVARLLGPEWQLMLFKGYITLYQSSRSYENGTPLHPSNG
jgi:hypothetical protein